MVRVFSKSANQPNEIALTICNPISRYCFRLMRDWNWKIYQILRKFPSFRSEWKKRSTFGGAPQFLNGISGKLPYHLTSNRNFRIFWLNGKHPYYPIMQFPVSKHCDCFQYGVRYGLPVKWWTCAL